MKVLTWRGMLTVSVPGAVATGSSEGRRKQRRLGPHFREILDPVATAPGSDPNAGSGAFSFGNARL